MTSSVCVILPRPRLGRRRREYAFLFVLIISNFALKFANSALVLDSDAEPNGIGD